MNSLHQDLHSDIEITATPIFFFVLVFEKLRVKLICINYKLFSLIFVYHCMTEMSG
jgi:hypothetical protein